MADGPGGSKAGHRRSLTLGQALDLAVRHVEAGRLDPAENLCRQILGNHPDHPAVLHLLGVVAGRRGTFADAEDLIARALAVDPDFAEAHNSLGLVRQHRGRGDSALDSFARAVALKPEFPEARFNWGNALLALGRDAAAVDQYRACLSLRPEDAASFSNLGTAMRNLGRTDEAVRCFRQALALDPGRAEVQANLGIALQDLGDLDAAVVSYRAALALDGGIAEIHNSLGLALQDLGRLEEAAACFRQALAVRPDYGAAHRHLALITRHTDHDPDVAAMEALYGSPDLGGDQRMHLAFALGKSYEDLGEYDAAFACFSEGNRLRRVSISFDIDRETRLFEKVTATFDEALMSRAPESGEPKSPSPIFILGMPRSGTSLVEQILASHPEVHGAGELEDLRRIVTRLLGDPRGDSYFEAVRAAAPADFRRVGAAYAERVGRIAGESRFATDKMPGNFLLIGMIRTALPRAKIIHCVRDPMDTGLSLYKTYFPATAHTYAYDLAEIGGYHRLYEGLMVHWHRLLPGVIHDVRYEDVVASPETGIRDLLAFCGLDWHPACLDFHATDRPVRTASFAQVRRPVYADSVRGWKRYERHLLPLAKALQGSPIAGLE